MDIPDGGQDAQNGSESCHKRRSGRPLPVPPLVPVNGPSVVAQPVTPVLQMDFPPGMIPIALPESPIVLDTLAQASQPRTPTRSPKTSQQQHHRTRSSTDSPIGTRLRTPVVEPCSPARSDTSHGSEASLIVIGEGFLLPSTMKTPPSVGRLLNARRGEFHKFNPVPYISETSHAYMLGNASAPVLPAIELIRITAPPPTREGSPSTSLASSSFSSPNPSMESFPSYTSEPVVSLRFPYYPGKPLSPIQERTSNGRRTSPSPRGPRPPRPFPIDWNSDHSSPQSHRGSFSCRQQGVSPEHSQGQGPYISSTPPMLHRFNTSPSPSNLHRVPLQEQRRHGMNVHASVFEPSLSASSHQPTRAPALYRTSSLPDMHSSISSAHQSRRGSLEDPHLAAFQSYPPPDEMTELLSAWYMNTFVPERDGHSQLEQLRKALFSMQLPQSQQRRPSVSSASSSSGLRPPQPRTGIMRALPSQTPSLQACEKNTSAPMPVPALLPRMENQSGTSKNAARARPYVPHPQQISSMIRPQPRPQHRMARLQTLNLLPTHDTVDLTQDLTPIELPEHPSGSLDAAGKLFSMHVMHFPDFPLHHPQANDSSMAYAGGSCIDPATPEKSAASPTMQSSGSAGTLVDRGKTTLTPVTERSEPLSAQASPSNAIPGDTTEAGMLAETSTRRSSWKNQRSWRKGRNRNRSAAGLGGSKSGAQP